MSHHAKILVRQSMVYTIGNLLGRGTTFLLIPVYTHLLTPEGYGIIEIMRALFNVLVLVFVLSLDNAVVRFRYDNESDEGYRSFLGSVGIFAVIAAAIIALLLDIFRKQAFSWLIPDILLDSYLRIVLWTTCLAVLGRIVVCHYRAVRKPSPSVLLELLRSLLVVAGSILFVAVLKQGSLGKLWGDFAAYAVYFVISAIIFLIVAKPAMQLHRISEALKFGLPLVPTALSLWIMSFIDRIMLQQLRTTAEAGIYSFGYNIGIILALTNIAFSKAWSPFFYEEAQKGTVDKAVPKLATQYVALIMFVGLGICVFSRHAVALLAPPEYAYAATVVPLIIYGYVFFGAWNIFGTQVSYAKKTLVLTYLTIICALINVGVNYLLIPSCGMHGAAVATTLTFIILGVSSYIAGSKIFYVKYEVKKQLITLLAFSGLLLVFMNVQTKNLLFTAFIGVAHLVAFLVIVKLVVGLPGLRQLRSLITR
ncbi:MAG: oligosaccharide flippase family protein [Planctomycetota bacterium]